MNTETIKAAAAYHMIEKARELLHPEPSPDALDTIIRFESCIVDMELHMAKRKAPFDAAELALFTRLERILKKAKEIYMTT